MGGLVGKEADLADAEVGEDLAAKANLAEDALVGSAELLFFAAGAIGMVNAERCGLGGAVDRKAALGVVEVDEGTATGGGDGGEG